MSELNAKNTLISLMVFVEDLKAQTLLPSSSYEINNVDDIKHSEATKLNKLFWLLTK